MGQEKQLQGNSCLKIHWRQQFFFTGSQLVGHGGRQCCEGDCKLEHVDSPLKVLTDSGGRMIPEELDKALDKVKAEGRVSYQRSWVKRRIAHPRFRSSSTQHQGRQCLGHTTIWKRWLKFAPNIRLTNILKIDTLSIVMHWFPWTGPRVLVHHIFRFGCMWTLAGEAQQFFQGT